MLYKPKYCCQCGEGIERVDWKLWTSRRFCELCETEFVVNEWGPKIYLVFSLILGTFFFGSYLQISDRSLKAGSENDSISPTRKVGQPPAGDSEPHLSDENSNTTSSGRKQTNGKIVPLTDKPDQRTGTERTFVQPDKQSEPVFFCGAETKKGTPCSRRVKGGGRCWQHQGKPAMLPDKQLRISQ